MTRRGLALLGVVLALALPALAAASASATAADDGARRVLVVSLPHVTWSDLDGADLPNLRRLLDDSAVANLAVRVQRLQTRPGDGYTTIGAGTRAVAPARVAGLAYEPGEPVEGGQADAVFRRRTGTALSGSIGQLEIGSIRTANDRALFGGEAGVLGDALRAAGWTTAVVANADRSFGDRAESEMHREAATALMGRDGVVACGRVGRDLLEEDVASPFGVRLDEVAVVQAFDRCWGDRTVALVEASDLSRADAYRPRTTNGQGEMLFRAALRHADTLVGRLLERVDLERDAVVVVAPASPQSEARLTVFAVHAPGVRAGLLVSGSTRQTGFVTMQDVGPTIADVAGLERPEEMEGRAATVDSGGGSAEDRLEFLVGRERDARFRDRLIAPVVTSFIVAQVLLSFGVLVVLGFRPGRWARLLEIAALGILCFLPLTYLSALLPFSDWGKGAYAAFVVGGAAVLAVAIDRFRSSISRPLEIVFGLMIAVTALSVVFLDSRLNLSTVFGDSPIVAGRFAGVNNVTFAQLMVAAILLSCFLVHRVTDRRGVAGALVLLAAVVSVNVMPMWGADVGGIFAGLPALAIVGTMLGGWRVRVRTVVTWAVVTVGAVLALGFLDLTRESSKRTHLGRLFERVGADGWDGFATVVHRKLGSNVATLTRSAWSIMVIPLLVLAVIVIWRAPGRLRSVRERIPELRIAFVGLVVAGSLGYALNDSGVAVPGMMLAVLTPAMGYLLLRVDP